MRWKQEGWLDGWMNEGRWRPAWFQIRTIYPQYMLIPRFSPPGLLGKASISIGPQVEAATGLTTGIPDQAPLPGETLFSLLLTPLPEERTSWGLSCPLFCMVLLEYRRLGLLSNEADRLALLALVV